MEAGRIAAPRPGPALLGIPLAALLALVSAVILIALLFGTNPGCGGGRSVGSLSAEVPSWLSPLYLGAAQKYRLGPQGPAILAAINKVESDFGRNRSTSSAGAVGWMQFEPATWAAYGVDANHDGSRNPNDPADAIFSAANYLRAAGAPADWHRAILAYNHAEWYVTLVLSYARGFQGTATFQTSASCALAATPNALVNRMVLEAARIARLHLPYVWGGGHMTPAPANGPFDCSSAVSRLLQVAGFHNATMTTAGLASWGDPGPGRWVTIFVKSQGTPDDHTFLLIAGRFWGTSRSNPSEPLGGPGWIPSSVETRSYLAGFQRRHPPSL